MDAETGKRVLVDSATVAARQSVDTRIRALRKLGLRASVGTRKIRINICCNTFAVWADDDVPLDLACMGGDTLPALAPPQAEVTVVTVDAKVESGEPVLVEVKSLVVRRMGCSAWHPICGRFGRSVGGGRRTCAGRWTERTHPTLCADRSGWKLCGRGIGRAGSWPDDQERTFEPSPCSSTSG